jgi:Tfp pilus assembly protein PilE
MAGGKLKRRLPASGILEVIVSMVIIVIVFGIAMMIYTNVLRLSLSAKKVKAYAILQETMLKAEHTAENVTQSVSIADFRIEQEVKPYLDNINLAEIHLTAFDQNQQKIAELQKVIINKHE